MLQGVKNMKMLRIIIVVFAITFFTGVQLAPADYVKKPFRYTLKAQKRPNFFINKASKKTKCCIGRIRKILRSFKDKRLLCNALNRSTLVQMRLYQQMVTDLAGDVIKLHVENNYLKKQLATKARK